MSAARVQKHEKDESYWEILSAAIELDCKKGHLKWTLSDLSRKSHITRSLIYYYFGRSKMSILDEAIKLIGDEFVGLSAKRLEMWKEGRLLESMMHTRRLYEKAPYLCSFILEHREKDNEVGQALRQVDANFKSKLKKHFSNLDDSQLGGLYAVYWGVTFAPNLKEKHIANVLHLIKKYLD